MGKINCTLILVFLIFSCSTFTAFAAPLLNFSDIISGPSSGLNDGLGEGAIVTVWGNGLGSSQGDSTISVCGTTPAYIYYWKNADGTLPGGPADLYSSHKMQEVAFSIPSSCSTGATTISVTVDGKISNTLPFTVRSGNIYHAKATGSPSNNGSFSSPWLSIYSGGLNGMSAGDILYLHDGTHDTNTYYGKYGVTFSGKTGTLANQRAYVTYPGSRYMVIGDEKGIDVYLSDSIVIAKLSVRAGHYDEPAESSTTILTPPIGGAGIRATKNGRVVANEITDSAGKCNSGWGGAITASAGGASYDYIGNLKVFGNYIHDWGCPQTSHFEHTTYMSVRNVASSNVEPWEMGWNHLKDNQAKYGIHNYDETSDSSLHCGSPTGTVKLHDNYVINQKGPGLHVGAGAPVGDYCWTGQFDIYNNVIINTGLGPIEDENGADMAAIRILDAGLNATVNIYNNSVYGYSDGTASGSTGFTVTNHPNGGWVTVNFSNNIIFDTYGSSFTTINQTTTPDVSGSNNLWYSSAGTSTSTVDSRLTDNIFANPQYISATDLHLSADSPALNIGAYGGVINSEILPPPTVRIE